MECLYSEFSVYTLARKCIFMQLADVLMGAITNYNLRIQRGDIAGA